MTVDHLKEYKKPDTATSLEHKSPLTNCKEENLAEKRTRINFRSDNHARLENIVHSLVKPVIVIVFKQLNIYRILKPKGY